MSHIYETIILGGGPAGLSAALYAGRGKLDTLLIEKATYGGQVATTYEVDNYPGTDLGITGPELSEKMRKQAEYFKTKFIKEDIVSVELSDKIKKVITNKGEHLAKTIIIATGAQPKMVGFKGEIELRGRGVSYCATCDADFYTDLPIAVIGGGDSALQEALYLTKFASKVTIIHRRQGFRAAQYLVDKTKANPKIEFLLDTVVEEAVEENGLLTGLRVKNVITEEISDFATDGVFVFVGLLPNTGFLRDVEGLEFDAVTAAVLGGIAMGGGIGSLLGALNMNLGAQNFNTRSFTPDRAVFVGTDPLNDKSPKLILTYGQKNN